MNDKCFQYIVNLYFNFNFLSWFHIYIILIFSSLVFLNYNKCLFIQTFNFLSIYDCLFNNFNYYKCLCRMHSNTLK